MKSLISFVFPLLLFIVSGINSQEISNAPESHDVYLGNNTSDRNDVSGVNVVKEQTKAEKNLNDEILSLKREDNPANRDRIVQLNSQLESMTGYSSTKFVPYTGGGIVQAQNQNPPFITDNITNIRVYNGGNGRLIHGIATCTEQRGANIGRIWVVYAFSANTSSPDSLRMVYSDNGGSTWNLYALAWLGGTDKINYEDLDAEIIENTSGSKYLWVVYGIRSSGGSGNWFTGGLVINITSFAGGLYAFSWPGNSTSKRYYNVRITTDNQQYSSAAWTYIACSFDSTNGSNFHVNTQKYARCLNPYTTSPSFSYQGEKFWWFNGGSPAGYIRTLYTDIAYIRHGTSDSIIVSFSGVPDSTRIFYAKVGIGGAPSTGNGATSQAGSDAGYKTWARLASNDYDNGSVVCVFRQYYPSHWNVKYFRTTNYGNFSTVNQSILWGSSANTNYQPDIVGLRGKDVYYFTFNTIASTDSVHLVKVTTTGGTSHITKLNYIGLVSGTQGSKPGFRYVNSDSCFAIYSENGPYNVWATLGCSGNITGVPGNINQIPRSFALYQNYPNPFNPVTSVRFDIPKASNVKLVVYDILGREVKTLLNEYINPGTYNIDFDASNLASGTYFYKLEAGDFNAIKKMVLVK